MDMDYKELLEKAKEASEKAYAPFSKFKVGSCVLSKSQKVYCGCNVENSSFGLTICAERNALTTAVAQGEREFLAIAIYSPEQQNCTPCGACRQFIYEFQKDYDIDIIVEVQEGYRVYKMSELLPEGFHL